MTYMLRVRNVNQAFKEAWWWLNTTGVEEDSRAGPVLVAPGPVLTEYRKPCERVLFNPVRDANPVFHLMESIWMLAGRRHVGWLTPFSTRIAMYAEDTGNIHGAYGHRWRNHFGKDQLLEIANTLKRDRASRQAVLQMWDPEQDLGGIWRDRPCNTAVYFDCRGDHLNMTVTCRSNDMLWGAYGANAVHFSVLQEVMAGAVDLPVGVYRQFSNNFHVYRENQQVKHFLQHPPYDDFDAYTHSAVPVIPIMERHERLFDFLEDCERFVNGSVGVRNGWLRQVAAPLRDAYLDRRAGRVWSIDKVPDCDWKLAFTQWIERRTSNESK